MRRSAALALALAATAAFAVLPAPAPGQAADRVAEQVMATDQFEYSYSRETGREIFENWLDVSWLSGSFRAGLLLDHRQPAEEGDRAAEVRHRFFEFRRGGVDLRVGHFYGLFGRGLVFAGYEDRLIRIDTALDGVVARAAAGGLRATAFSGAPAARDLDVRGLDLEADFGSGGTLGLSGLTYRPDDLVGEDGRVHREWVAAGRLQKLLAFGDLYLEYGWKKGWDSDVVPDDAWQNGHALYGGLNLYAGAAGLALEVKDYRRFTVVRRADGRAALNRPPALTREHQYALLARAAEDLDQDDEVGAQAELTLGDPSGWSALLNASRTERHGGALLHEEAYGQLERVLPDGTRLRGGFGYQESDARRRTVVLDLTWPLDATRSLTLVAEHQHVRLGAGPGFDLGAFDQQHLKLEFAAAPRWSAAALLELNDKYDAQRARDERRGPFPAGLVTYTSDRGVGLTLWAGKRQAGQVCSGGVCKYEPAFEGVELTGVLRY